ncbi:phosphoserine phosphatase SerB [Swaminathania salitolerans]|uniref:Phosphoserine phosphatase n=1 Tax=Swaminathania salitolerans TaxID=182838 RepID=A0A511BQP9_9PROT|nr:phosphoserine phosphatase SerB [Swaminathania salitolerans]GBQ11262.1 phosphoserine phosphatase [Swaminathania salitolerans LMG 21291]GEL02402.1 phosphoserine phosphatase SerB [Swaminathania salitolerans]
MTLPYVLVLVADPAQGTLSKDAIDIARNMVKGKNPIVLSPGEAVEIPCPAPSPGAPTIATIRATLARYRTDALMVKSRGRRKAVLIADMDSTILAGETLDELAALLGCGDEVAELTRQSMNGTLDFEDSLRARVALLKGRETGVLEAVWESSHLNAGARCLVQTMRANNARTALVSGGFTWFTSRVAEACGFDEHHGNVLGMDANRFTGALDAPVLGPDSKQEHLERLLDERGVKASAALATGDGANDLPMLALAGLGIAYKAKPRIRQMIDMQVNHSTLRAHLFAQGYPASVFVE